MNPLYKKKIFTILVILSLNFSLLFTLIDNTDYNISVNTKQDSINLKQSSNGFDPSGKTFSTATLLTQSCYIYRDEPNLSNQPELYIPNYLISHANLDFSDIYAYNYTKTIETDTGGFIESNNNTPTYVYQKFSVEVSQYVNVISINVEDDMDPNNYSVETDWEVAITNCIEDTYGTPNNETLGSLSMKHPIFDKTPTWMHFDFLNNPNSKGPIYLNISETLNTSVAGRNYYWFAFRVKIPRGNSESGGGAKKLFFNPDTGGPFDNGEGDTFFLYDYINYENFTNNYVAEIDSSTPINGIYREGDLNSFIRNDTDRYTVSWLSNNLTLEFYFNIENHSNPAWSYDFLGKQPEWWWYLNTPLQSIDLELITKVTNINNLLDSQMWIYNYSDTYWYNLREIINITTEKEELLTIRLSELLDMRNFLRFMNTSDNNKLKFKLEYNSTGDFDVSINKFSINFGKVETLSNTILPYDPTIIDLYEPFEVIPINGTQKGGDSFSLRFNDNNYYRAQAKTDNLSIQFRFKLFDDTNERFWDFYLYDWIYNLIYPWKKYPLYPYPTVPRIEFRLAANVSIDDNYNDQLEIAILDIYNYLEDEWINITEGNKDLAIKDEYQIVQPIPTSITWLFLQLIDRNNDNALKMRLRYVGNESESFEKFNVTVDEFTLLFYIQNIYSSDLTSKIEFGLDSSQLKPSDIQMTNFGIPILDNGDGNGNWNNYISNEISEQNIFTFNVESLWPVISFNVSGICQIYKFEINIEFDDKIEMLYLVGTNYFSVEVTDDEGDPIEGIEMIFELLDSDDKVVEEDTAVTNEDGIAKGALDFEETGESYKIKVSYDEEGIYDNDDIESDEFRIDNEMTLLINTLIIWSPYILIGIAALVMFVVVRHHKLSKLRAEWAREALTLDDLLKINYILIIHKDAGVTIYSKQISMDLDSDLIGGFLTAISQFRSELKKDVISKPGEKGFEMDYYDNKIVITDGQYVRVALILDGIPSEILKENQREFTRRFEMKFGANLVDFTGDVRPFKETDELVDRIFDIKLMYPLKLSKDWEFTKLNKLEKALVEVGLEMQKERKYIFASSLLSYGLAGRKASRDQIISTILSLKRRGILIPIEIE